MARSMAANRRRLWIVPCSRRCRPSLRRDKGRYWIMTVNGPQWFDIDEREVDPALEYLFEKKQQQEGQ